MAHHLQRLDRSGLADLVAALWAARGFETTHEGDVVVAASGGTRRVIAPVAASRWPGAGGSLPDRPVDVVVAPGGAPEDVPADVEVLGAVELAEQLRYAVPPETGRALCETHLGAAPAALSAPLADRVRARLAPLRGVLTTPGTGRHADLEVPLAAGALVVLLWLGTVAGLSGVGLTGGGAGPAAAGGTPTGTAAGGTTATPSPPPGAAAVPGVDTSGITNGSALVAAHREVLAGKSFTAWVDVYRPRDGDPNASRVQRDVDVMVDGGRFLAITSVEGPETRRRVRSVYHDGQQAYLADWSGENATYRELLSTEPALPLFGDPETFRGDFIARYLDVVASRVTARVSEEGRTHYRIVGEGLARRVRGISDYRVVAMVDRRGLVHQLAAEFRVQDWNGSYRVRVTVTYDRIGNTTVTAPPWYDKVRERLARAADSQSPRAGPPSTRRMPPTPAVPAVGSLGTAVPLAARPRR